VQPDLVDAKESTLLEVGLNDAPTATQVLIDSKLDQVTKGSPCRLALHTARVQLRIAGYVAEVDLHGLDDLVGDHIESQLPLGLECREDRRSQEGHLHEIVEVARLEGCILTVVCEAQDLAGILRDFALWRAQQGR